LILKVVFSGVIGTMNLDLHSAHILCAQGGRHKIRWGCWCPSPHWGIDIQIESKSTYQGHEHISTIHQADRPIQVMHHWQESTTFFLYPLDSFNTDRKFYFFCDIPIVWRALYTTSDSCKKRPRDARNIWWLRKFSDLICVRKICICLSGLFTLSQRLLRCARN